MKSLAMKTNIYIILAVSLIFSLAACKNVNKLVEQGRYNEAIEYAVKKMAGEEDKKVEHVKALEKSFNRLNSAQYNEIQELSARPSRENWGKVIRLSNEIIDRQVLVAPLTPLYAQNGYQAKLQFVDAEKWHRKAVEEYVALSWKDYESLISSARNGNKQAARKAYYLLEEIGFYEGRAEISEELDEAKGLGTHYILMKVVRHESARLNNQDMESIKQFFQAEPVREIWSEIHNFPQEDITYDYLSEIAIQDVMIHPGAADQTLERISREVQTGEKAQRDSKGKVVVDSTGEVIMIPIYEMVRGEIIKVRQYKNASILFEIRIVERGNTLPISATKETISADFTNYYQDWRGDKRAFERVPRREHPVPFPPDEVLLQDGVRILQEFALDYTVDWVEKLN